MNRWKENYEWNKRGTKKLLGGLAKPLLKIASENIPAVKASYHAAELIAEGGRPFTDGEFVKQCMLLQV